MQWYLDLCGANPGAYKFHSSHNKTGMIFQNYKVGTRPEQIEIIDRINNFDGIAHIVIHFEGNERVEDYVFLNTLNVYWDRSKEAKRTKRLQKIKAKIIS